MISNLNGREQTILIITHHPFYFILIYIYYAICYILEKYPLYLSTNLARGKQAEQFGKSAWNPNNAVNGDYTGWDYKANHGTETSNSIGSWWQVDLKAVYDIKMVVILNQGWTRKLN